MTAWVLRTELRRSAAPWAGMMLLLLGAAGLYLNFTSGDGWGARWTRMVLAQREFLLLLWPLALGVGAWQGRRDHRARMGELLAASARPHRLRVLPAAAAMAIAVTAGYLGMLAAGAAQVAPTATYHTFGWVPISAVGALSLVAAVWLGMAAGRLLPSVLTPPLLAVAALLTLLAPAFDAAPLESGVDLLSPVLLYPRDDFVTVAGRVSAGQSVWLAALAAAGLLLLGATGSRAQLAALLPAVLGAAVALPLLSGGQAGGVYVTDPGATEPICTDDTPKVCVTSVHAAVLPDLAEPARRALEILAELPAAPATVQERATREPAGQQDPEVLVVDGRRLTLDPGGRLRFPPPSALAWHLLDGAGTQPCGQTPDPWSDRGLREPAARAVAAAWLLGEPPSAAPTPDPTLRAAPDPGLQAAAERAWTILRSFPPQEQRERVAALRQAALACDGDLLDILTRPAAPGTTDSGPASG